MTKYLGGRKVFLFLLDVYKNEEFVSLESRHFKLFDFFFIGITLNTL